MNHIEIKRAGSQTTQKTGNQAANFKWTPFWSQLQACMNYKKTKTNLAHISVL